MAQSSASAAAEVLRAGDMDTSISKKKRKRSKKDRGLADLSIASINAPASVSSTKPSNTASVSQPSIYHAAQADRAKSPSKLPTAIPPHLVVSKKRKRAATPQSNTHIDTGSLPNSLVHLEDDTSSNSDQNGRRRKRARRAKTHLACNGKDESSTPKAGMSSLPKIDNNIRAPPSTSADATARPGTSSTSAVLAAAPETESTNGAQPAAALSRRQNEMQQPSSRQQHPLPEGSSVRPVNDSRTDVLKKDKRKKRKAERRQAETQAEASCATAIAALLPADDASSDTASKILRSQDQATLASTSAAILSPAPAAALTTFSAAINNASTSASTSGSPQAVPATEDNLPRGQSPTARTTLSAGPEKPTGSKKVKSKKRKSVSVAASQFKPDITEDGQDNTRISPATVDTKTQRTSRYSAENTSLPSRASVETVPRCVTSLSGLELSAQSSTGTTSVVPSITQPPTAQTSQAEVLRSKDKLLARRLRLFDEESDTDLFHFEMREYAADDTNHTDDEDAGLYIPQPSDLLALHRRDSALSSSRSPVITPSKASLIANAAEARPGDQGKTMLTAKTTPTAIGQPSSSRRRTKSKSPDKQISASSAKSEKRIVYTTPSRIMQNFVHGPAKASSAARSEMLQPDEAGPDTADTHEELDEPSNGIDASANPKNTLAVESEGRAAKKQSTVSNTAQTSNVGLAPALVVSQKQATSKSAMAPSLRPVVEITVRRTASPASPRKSLANGPRPSFTVQPVVVASDVVSSEGVIGSTLSPLAASLPSSDHAPNAPAGSSSALTEERRSSPSPSIAAVNLPNILAELGASSNTSGRSAIKLDVNGETSKAPSSDFPVGQAGYNQSRSPSQPRQAEELARPASPPSPPSLSSFSTSAKLPPTITDAMDIDELVAPPAEQVTSSTLLTQEGRAEPRIMRFLEDIHSDDSNSDTEDSSTSDSDDDQDITHVRAKRKLPSHHARYQSSSLEPASDESDEDSANGAEDTGNTPAMVPKVRSLSPLLVQDAIHKASPQETHVRVAGVTEDDHENDSQILLETIAHMVSSAEVKRKALSEQEDSTESEKDTSKSSAKLLGITPPRGEGLSITREAEASTSLPSQSLPASERVPPASPQKKDVVEPASHSLEPVRDPSLNPLTLVELADKVHLPDHTGIVDEAQSASGLTVSIEDRMTSAPFRSPTSNFEPPESIPPHLPAHSTAPLDVGNNIENDIDKDHTEPLKKQDTTRPAHNALTGSIPDFSNSTSIPSPSRDAQRLYPCLSALDSDMSQPMFATLGSQSSPNGSDMSQMDELEQTQLLPGYASSVKPRFRDFGPTPSPLQTGFDTASQIDELMQSSFDERSMIAAERRERDEHNNTQNSDDESRSSRDSQSGILPSSKLPHQLLQDPTYGAIENARPTSELDIEALNAPPAAEQTVGNPEDVVAMRSPDIGQSALQPKIDAVIARENDLVPGTHASPELLSEPSSPTSSDAGHSMNSQKPAAMNGSPRSARHTSADAGSVCTQTRSMGKRSIFPPVIAAMAIPSVLPRSNSISAISNRFQGKLAERRNSGTIPRVSVAAKPTQPPTQSADSSDESDEDEDSDSDSRVTPEQNLANKQRRVGLAALR